MTLTTERQQFEEWFNEEIVLHISTSNEAVVRLMWKAWQASRELLANREAQPVYQYRMRNPYNGQVTDWETTKPEQVDFILKETIAANVEFRIIAAPPAPANANAVAWEMRYWNSGHNMWHDWERITAEQHAEMSVQHAADNDYEFRVLYDATLSPGASR